MTAPELELCWGTLAGVPVEGLLRAASANGFRAVTVTPAMARAGFERHGAGLRTMAADLGVAISMLDPLIRPLPGTPGPGDVASWMSALFEVDTSECLDLAAEAGAESVNLAHFMGDPAVSPSALGDAIFDVCAQAAQRGLRATVEFFPESALGDLHAARTLVEDLAAPNLGIMLDTLHLVRSGGSAADVAALELGLVGGLQIADRTEVPPDQPYVPMSGRALPGQGSLPLRPILTAALQRGRDGLRVGVEVFDARLRDLDPAEAARLAGDATRDLLAQAGG